MISVIVPVYKAEKVVARCIESVIAQEYKDWELILVDDGSPDRSGEICDEYAVKDERIRVVHQKNAGASAARNHGIKVARGEFICFIDSDDYVSPYYLSDFFIYPDSLDFVLQGHTGVYNNKPENICVNKLSAEHGLKFLLENCDEDSLLQGPCCKLFKSSILFEYNILFPEDISIGEDAIFVKQYLLHCGDRMSTIAKSNYYYVHSNSDSLSSRFHDGKELYDAILKEYTLFNLLEHKVGELVPQAKKQFMGYAALQYYQSIYNLFIDKNYSIAQIKDFFDAVDLRLWNDVAKVNNLPRTFCVFAFCIHFIPICIYAPILRFLIKKR